MKKKLKKYLKKSIKEHLSIPDFSTECRMLDQPPLKFEDLDFQILSQKDSGDVYVKITGFNTDSDSLNYAMFLSKYLPLLLYKSTVLH